MLVVVQHQIKNAETAFARGEKLVKNIGAPSGARGLQFFPSQDGGAVTCLWEAATVESIQQYVDTTLGDASENTCYAIDESHSFADLPSGIAPAPQRVAG